MKKIIWILLNDLEKMLILLVSCSFILLLFCQIAFVSEKGRLFLSATDRLEGHLIQPLPKTVRHLPSQYVAVNQKKKAVLSFKVLPQEEKGQVKVLINGREIAHQPGSFWTVSVDPQDCIQVDTSACTTDVAIKIVAQSSNLSYPKVGTILKSKGNLISFQG